jgi:hypothetical protein
MWFKSKKDPIAQELINEEIKRNPLGFYMGKWIEMIDRIYPKEGELDKLGIMVKAYRIPEDGEWFLDSGGHISYEDSSITDNETKVNKKIRSGCRLILVKIPT